MNKVPSYKLKKLAEKYKDDKLLTDGNIIRCDSFISVDEKHQESRVNSHIRSSKHQKNKDFSKSCLEQQFIKNTLST